MFCPKCSQERVSTETSFCSRCGYLLTGTADLLQLGGLLPRNLPETVFQPSPRSRGIKKGVFISLLTFLIVPLLTILVIALQVRPPIAPLIIIITSILLVVGGLLRVAYAWLFESPVPHGQIIEDENMYIRPAKMQLPPQHTVPASSYTAPAAGDWRDTNDLEPRSVTEGTTKLIEKERISQ